MFHPRGGGLSASAWPGGTIWYVLVVAGLLLGLAVDLQARTKKGDRYFKEGREAQLAENWDRALALYEKALDEDPSDAAYQMAVHRSRFQAAQVHLRKALELRQAGSLDEALLELQKSLALDPGSSIVEQEIRATVEILERRQQDDQQGRTRSETPPLTPSEEAAQRARERIARLVEVPELQPISAVLSHIKMNNQPTKVLYETVGKLAGINVVFDPEFQPEGQKFDIDLTDVSLAETLRLLSVLTATFWKPLSKNTIFVTNDNVTKRRDHEEMVVRVFYLKNITTTQELQEIATAVRSVTDIRRLFTYNSQNAILVRGSTDQVALAEKLLADLDKPLAEVVVDVIVMEANRTRTRDLAAAIQSQGQAGISVPLVWNPVGLPGVPDNPDGGNSGGTGSGGFIQLGRLGSITKNDWSLSLPGALLSALMSDRQTRILQRPQLRAADGQKASLRLGDRIPYATGSFQPGVGAVGVSPLVSTQFQYADVGVNVDLTPKIHGESDVSMHIEIEISAVRERIDVGGLEQPVIGQRKVAEDIRVKDGEVTLLGGLTQDQRTFTKGGGPGLNEIPIIKWLGFNSESKERSEGELLIALIPRIVRRPDISEVNLRGIAAGSDQVVKVNYLAQSRDEAPAEAEPDENAGSLPAQSAADVQSEIATTPAILKFSPNVISTKVGDIFTVALDLENGRDLFEIQMEFQFDGTLLQMSDAVKGNLLETDNQNVTFVREIQNDSGNALFVLSRPPGAGGVTGDGSLLATLRFQAIAAGTTRITIPYIKMHDSEMLGLGVSLPVLPVVIEGGENTVPPASGQFPPGDMLTLDVEQPGVAVAQEELAQSEIPAASEEPAEVAGLEDQPAEVSEAGPLPAAALSEQPVSEPGTKVPDPSEVVSAPPPDLQVAAQLTEPGVVEEESQQETDPRASAPPLVESAVIAPTPVPAHASAVTPATEPAVPEVQYAVQIASYSNPQTAAALFEDVAAQFGRAMVLKLESDSPVYRVLVGAGSTYAEAVEISDAVGLTWEGAYVRRLTSLSQIEVIVHGESAERD